MASNELIHLNLRTPISGLGLRVIYHLDLDDQAVIEAVDLIWKKTFRPKALEQLSTQEKKIARAMASLWSGSSSGIQKLNFSEEKGTPFQRQVWAAAQEIPSGTTLSYGELAKKIRKPKAARAVGQALNKNPWPLCVPCHRITASNHKLGGFALGSELKKILLSFEKNPSYRD